MKSLLKYNQVLPTKIKISQEIHDRLSLYGDTTVHVLINAFVVQLVSSAGLNLKDCLYFRSDTYTLSMSQETYEKFGDLVLESFRFGLRLIPQQFSNNCIELIYHETIK